MLKPPMGAGGDGLEVIATLDALRDRFERPGPEGAPELPTLVQEYFDGEDIDFNAFVLGGDCRASSVMWTRFHERSPRFSITEFAEHEEARRLAERLLGEVAFNGPVNIDMRIRADDGSVQFIEVNPRFWARTPQALVDGINFIESGIRAAVGNPSVQSSSGSRVPWPSSLVRPVVAFLRYRDPALLQMLLRLSSIQIRYLTYTQLYLAYAKVRSRLAREPSSEPSSQSAR
jgi:predicted ATP-grasp superfamily ATP-dependent carboligase